MQSLQPDSNWDVLVHGQQGTTDVSFVNQQMFYNRFSERTAAKMCDCEYKIVCVGQTGH